MRELSDNTILEVDSINKSFRNVHAVNQLSFSIERGDIFAFLGPNGAGKTTTLRILLDIIRPDSGSVSWNLNARQQSIPPPPQIGYLPEERGLYTDLPVMRSLIYLASIRGMQPGRARAAAMHWLAKLGLEDRANEKLMALSKGNQQKVQFVSAILHQPAFAVLDEPFSGLDPLNQEKFIEYIKELNQQGMTIILSSHQMTLVEKIANKICLINKGEKLYNGTLTHIYKAYGHKHILDVEFDNTIPAGHIKSLNGVESVIEKEPQKARITLHPGASLNHFFSDLSNISGLTSIKSHNSNLHDIFLNLVNNHQS